jgi:hypothetical protein
MQRVSPSRPPPPRDIGVLHRGGGGSSTGESRVGRSPDWPHRSSWDLNPGPALLPADFGFAQHMSPWDEKHVLRGSPLYMAPEMVCRRQYDARVDLWSVGVILYGETSLPLLSTLRVTLYLGQAFLGLSWVQMRIKGSTLRDFWSPFCGRARPDLTLFPSGPSSAFFHRSPLWAAPLCLQIVLRARRKDSQQSGD